MNINFEYYKIFYYVAKYENITIAAKNLNMSQPSVSRYINLLEHETGYILFDRSKTGAKLTPSGQILLGHISQAVKHFFKAEEDLNINNPLHDNILRIGASEITLQIFLLSYLEKFKTKNPNTHLKIQTFNSRTAIANLQADLVDFAIVPSPIISENTLTNVKLASFVNIVIAGNKYKHLKNKQLHLKDLNTLPLITLAAGTAGRKYVEDIYLKHGIFPEPEIELPTSDLITPMAVHNLGIAIVPAHFAASALQNNQVIKLNIIEDIPPRFIFLVTSNIKQLSPAGENFLALLPKRQIQI